ncbi:MAG: hypothetical protein PHE43_01950 [Candidatus Nanoarchaeia archaeon]|nr:hypothetical protein [Candidatus Nanoarchaeia archaeon]
MRTLSRIKSFEERLLKAVQETNMLDTLSKEYPHYLDKLIEDGFSLDEGKFSAKKFIETLKENKDIDKNVIYGCLANNLPEYSRKKLKTLLFGKRPTIYYIE